MTACGTSGVGVGVGGSMGGITNPRHRVHFEETDVRAVGRTRARAGGTLRYVVGYVWWALWLIVGAAPAGACGF